MATLATWVAETRRHLMSGRNAERNLLQGAYIPGSGSLTFVHPLGGIVPGARLAVGLNVFYVAAVNNTGLQVSVIGGQEGSADEAAPSGSLVWVNPRFTDFEIVAALNEDLDDLSAPNNGLFQAYSVDLPYSPNEFSYILGFAYTDWVIDVADVRVADSTAPVDWVQVPRSMWRFDRFGGGEGAETLLNLRLAAPQARAGATLRVVLRMKFMNPAALADDLSTTGLPPTAWDIPPIGAAARLMMPREVKRNFTEAQADSRRAAEVPPGAILGSARALMAWRQQRIVAEASRLTAMYPDKVF